MLFYLMRLESLTSVGVHSEKVRSGTKQLVLYHSIGSNIIILCQNWPI